MSKSTQFFEAVEHRRSYYGITKESPLSNEQLKELIEKSVKHTPTSFNSQSSRAVLVTGKKNADLWDLILKLHLKTLDGDKEKEAYWTDKIHTQFKAGYGTVIFLEDQNVINEFSGKMPYLSTLFPRWSENSSGILQYIVWTALEAEGYGASLQHYGSFVPEVETEVNKFLDLPSLWKNIAILPFGKPSGPPGQPGKDKTFQPIEERTRFFLD
ncbi:uncharacterized protein L201_000624 [Kwoniella dendrophila CBS 6074]|uniref:Nitroreductase domain-containing protein n=1 Tax=Kwoniella dendrophila CBS 6074 TaxID=1295534 RepID=A0AAX4JLG6_9TREE